MVDAEAAGSRLVYDGATVTIERLGGIARSVFGQSVVTLPVGQIAGVEWREPSWARSGHIRFAVPGSQAAAGKTPVNRDEHAVLFGRKQAKAFAAVRDAVRAALTR